MENAGNYQLKPHKIPLSDVKANIHVDSGDHSILKVYKRLLNAPMRAVIHSLLGLRSRCFVEKHDQQIKDLEERVETQAFIIVKYIEKYEQLHPSSPPGMAKSLIKRKDLLQQETNIKGNNTMANELLVSSSFGAYFTLWLCLLCDRT